MNIDMTISCRDHIEDWSIRAFPSVTHDTGPYFLVNGGQEFHGLLMQGSIGLRKYFLCPCTLNLVLYMSFRIFAYSSNNIKSNFDLMDSIPVCKSRNPSRSEILPRLWNFFGSRSILGVQTFFLVLTLWSRIGLPLHFLPVWHIGPWHTTFFWIPGWLFHRSSLWWSF